MISPETHDDDDIAHSAQIVAPKPTEHQYTPKEILQSIQGYFRQFAITGVDLELIKAGYDNAREILTTRMELSAPGALVSVEAIRATDTALREANLVDPDLDDRTLDDTDKRIASFLHGEKMNLSISLQLLLEN